MGICSRVMWCPKCKKEVKVYERLEYGSVTECICTICGTVIKRYYHRYYHTTMSWRKRLRRYGHI